MLLNCPTCGKKISPNADPCPHCGEPGAGAYAYRETKEGKEELAAQMRERERIAEDCKRMAQRRQQEEDQRKEEKARQAAEQAANTGCLIAFACAVLGAACICLALYFRGLLPR